MTHPMIYPYILEVTPSTGTVAGNAEPSPESLSHRPCVCRREWALAAMSLL